MTDFTIEQLEALKEGTTPGPWAAIADYPYISIVIASDIDQIHAPIVDIKDGMDEPEVGKHHELMAAAPDLVDALIAEKQAHAELRAWVEGLHRRVDAAGGGSAVTFRKAIFLDEITRILEGDDG